MSDSGKVVFPIIYKGYEINPTMNPYQDGYDYVHEAYDPTPLHPDDPPADNRCGTEDTIQACKDAIDEAEDE